jgi:hypothetical protein
VLHLIRSRRNAAYDSFGDTQDLVGSYLGGNEAVPNIPQTPSFAYQAEGLHAFTNASYSFQIPRFICVKFKSIDESEDTYFILGTGFVYLMRPEDFLPNIAV